MLARVEKFWKQFVWASAGFIVPPLGWLAVQSLGGGLGWALVGAGAMGALCAWGAFVVGCFEEREPQDFSRQRHTKNPANVARKGEGAPPRRSQVDIEV
jgi:hypothetical protein